MDYLLSLSSSESIIAKIWNIYLTILSSINCDKKHIIAFDNFERYIGTDEICNVQLCDFIELMRHLQDVGVNNDTHYTQKFQVIVLMRNTSSRMSRLPLQHADFDGHEIDISGWFSVEEIVGKKIKWYEENKIILPKSDIIKIIMGQSNFDGQGIRSLHSKFKMLFNNNNRIIVALLARILDYYNKPYINKFCYFANNDEKLDRSLSTFAARTIIIRLLLNELLEDDFFQNILVHNKEDTQHRLGYSRRILTVLWNYSLQNNKYMKFDDFIEKLLGKGKEGISAFFDDNAKLERKPILQILYYMNYYNAREKNWLQFVDVQYNSNNGIKVSDKNEFENLIINHHDDVALKITTAGIAYIQYIVHSFEYFSCRTKPTTAPLLCLIPTIEELKKCNNIEDLDCLKTISLVQSDVLKCVKKMKENGINNRILYKRTKFLNPVKHEYRIYYSQSGYLNNFIDCVKMCYEKIELDEELQEKYDMLIQNLYLKKEWYNTNVC